MSKVIMGCAAVSIDGFIANESDKVGPLFDGLEACSDRPVTFVTDGVESAIEQARAFAGDRIVDLAAGQMGAGDVVRLDNPARVVQGDRVTHLLYNVSRPSA